jgi:signal transduction histidine kinase/FixJ family two-component response regulator
MTGFRVPLVVRLTLVFLGVAGFSTVVALALQDSSLARDLERAARTRLETAARATDRLVALQLRTTWDRYKAISRTPQFRANLEVDDPPTLRHYAAELVQNERASRVLFLNAGGTIVAGAGDAHLDPAATAPEEAALITRHGRPYVAVSVPLETEGQEVGRLVAIERINPTVVREWSDLCGAKVLFHPVKATGEALITSLPRGHGPDIQIRMSLAAERNALANSRRRLLLAGASALLLALLASLLLSRRLVLAVRSIKQAAERIGQGDLSIRIDSRRRDEVGDVACAVNEMASRLAQSRDAALESARLKSEFLANMSHEMRTPMHGIFGMTEILLDTAPSGEQRECAETIRRCADGLLTIVNDILDVSKIGAGKLELETGDFDLGTVVEEAAVVLAPRTAAKELELTCLVGADVPLAVRGDPGRLRQILLNLIGNAVKFTEQGEVVVRVTLAKQSDAHATVRFAITDTGIGIPAEQRHRLFQVFSQVDGSMTRQYGGTGLGLAISKQLVEMMGGEIGVESEVGRGSTFWFTCPFERSADPGDGPRTLPAALRGARVLVVDDNETNRTILHQLVQSWGMRSAMAACAAEALAVLGEAVRSADPFRLVLLDIKMPGTDGEALAQMIRADRVLADSTLIALTSLGQSGSVSSDGASLFAARLTKPLRTAQLRDCLVRALEAPPARPPAEETHAVRLRSA